HALAVAADLGNAAAAPLHPHRQLDHVGGAGGAVGRLIGAVPRSVAEDRNPFHPLLRGPGGIADANGVLRRLRPGGHARRGIVLGDERHVAQHVDDAAVAAEPGLFRSAFGPVHGRAGGWAGWPATTVTLIAMVSTWLGNVL